MFLKRAAILALLVSCPARADEHPVAPSDQVQASQVVKNGLYLIPGGGANTLVRLSGNGIILIDGKSAGNYAALASRIRKIVDELPIRVLVTTNQGASHTGTNADFLRQGVGVIAQDNAKSVVRSDDPVLRDSAPPSFTFASRYSLKLGGVPVELRHFGNGYSNTDVVAYFPDLKVIAVGDLFTSGPPSVEFENGGSLTGWSAALGEILKLDFAQVVPAKGSIVSRSELESYKTRLDTLISRICALVHAGVRAQDLSARVETNDLGWQLSWSEESWARIHSEFLQQAGR